MAIDDSMLKRNIVEPNEAKNRSKPGAPSPPCVPKPSRTIVPPTSGQFHTKNITASNGNPEVATDLNNLANLYKIQSKYAEAIRRFREALTLREQCLGKTHLIQLKVCGVSPMRIRTIV
jgi:hypothetical protein